MSMTSKVNPALRAAILQYVSGRNYSVFNDDIQFGVNYFSGLTVSLRTIQEATQKLTREGVLVRVGKAYRLAPANTTNGNAQVATAGTSSIG